MVIKNIEDYIINLQEYPIARRVDLHTNAKFKASAKEYEEGFRLVSRNTTQGLFLPTSFFDLEFNEYYESDSEVEFMGLNARVYSLLKLNKLNFQTQTKLPCLLGESKSFGTLRSRVYSVSDLTRRYLSRPTHVFFDLTPNNSGFSAREYLNIK